MLLEETNDLVHVGFSAPNHFQKRTIGAANGGKFPEAETLE